MMKRNYIYVVAGVFICSSCSTRVKQSVQEQRLDTLEKSHVVALSTAKMRAVDDELVLNGTVACDESLLGKIFVPCTGRVNGLRVEVGDRVSAGQQLAVVHSEEAADYRKGLNEADAEIRLAQRDYRMQCDMHQSGMASDKDVAAARERVLVANAERQRLHEVASINGYGRRSDAVLTSPISGYVIDKHIYNDSYVSEQTNDDPAIEIADLRRVWVIADVYGSDIAKVHPHAAVRVTTMAYPDEVFFGRVDKVYSVLDSESKTMKVRVCLDNPKGLLKPGMFASVHVRLSGSGQPLCAVPSSAVIFENGHDYVMVKQNPHEYRRREVKVVHTAGGYSYLSAGLLPDEKVVSKNALLYFNSTENE